MEPTTSLRTMQLSMTLTRQFVATRPLARGAHLVLDYAKFFSLSRDAVIRVYDETGNVIETREHAGEFKEV